MLTWVFRVAARTRLGRVLLAGGIATLAVLGLRRRGRGRLEGEDVVELLTARHRELQKLVEEYERATGDPQERPAILAELRQLLSIHEAVEQQLVHPLVRRQLPDGHRLAVEILDQEQAGALLLARIEETQPGTVEREELVRALFDAVRRHVDTEETAVFPLLRLHLGPRERMRLGAMVERAERLAPTHPHPHAPTTPAGNVVGMPVVRSRTRHRARR
jgi:hemerythrin-like domain-containing protein